MLMSVVAFSGAMLVPSISAAEQDQIGFELVILQSGDEIKSFSLSAGSGYDVKLDSGVFGYENYLGEGEVVVAQDADVDGPRGIYTSVIVFGEKPD